MTPEKEPLIKIDYDYSEKNRKSFERFLKEYYQEYKISGTYFVYYLKDNKLFSLKTYMSEIYFYSEYINVKTDEKNLELIKEIFEEFIKANPIKIRIEVKSND